MTQRVNTASVVYLRALFDYAQAHEIKGDFLADGAQVISEDRDARLSEAECAALFDRAADLLDDDKLGLHVGESIRPGHYGVLGYVIMNCATLGEALGQLRRYQAVVLDIGPPRMQATETCVELSWNPDTRGPYRQLAEFNLAALITFIRWISGRSVTPSRMGFTYPAPAALDEHQRVFGCPLEFGQPRYRMAFPADWLQLPLIQPDPAMRKMMERLADKQLLDLRRGDELLVRARSLVAQQLSEGEVELGELARKLHTSPRTLQRKLKDEGLSFTQLVDEVRRELAERYLADDRLALADVAFLLGFSEQSAFQRAFKRWTGTSPGGYRDATTQG